MAIRYHNGQDVHGYTVKQYLTSGGFATAYMAERNGRKVFLKQYKSPSLMVDWYRDFVDYQSKLKHIIKTSPDLVERTYEFIEFFEDRKAFHQVFEFIEGGFDLKSRLETDAQEMTQHERYTFASLLLFTLKLFHKHGIIHTDLKPDNLYLQPCSAAIGYNLKLIDFDFTVLENTKAPWDGVMAYVGTPHYLSPEHLTGKVPTKASDVFTAALICYELLSTSGHPYSFDEDVYSKEVLSYAAKAPQFRVPETPAVKEFGTLLWQALNPDAKKRPTIDELHSSIVRARRDFLNEGRSAPAARPESRPGTKPPAPKPPTPKPPSPKPPRPKPAPAATAPAILHLTPVGASESIVYRISGKFGSASIPESIDTRRFFGRSQFFLRKTDDGWKIRPEAGATNLTVLNGQPLTEETLLKDGDRIAIGSKTNPTLRDVAPMIVSFGG